MAVLLFTRILVPRGLVIVTASMIMIYLSRPGLPRQAGDHQVRKGRWSFYDDCVSHRSHITQLLNIGVL